MKAEDEREFREFVAARSKSLLVLSAPTIDQRMTDGHLDVFGDFTQKSAVALVHRLTGR